MGRLPELHRAVKRQDIDVVRALLKDGADPNDSALGSTPLMFASKLCNTQVIRLLLDAGADPNRAGPGDWTPLAMAASEGSVRAVALLLKAGADPRRPFFGSTVAAHVRRYCPERKRIIDLLETGSPNAD